MEEFINALGATAEATAMFYLQLVNTVFHRNKPHN